MNRDLNRDFVDDWRRRSQESTFNPGDEKEKLFLLYCDKVENGEIDPPSTSAMTIVDNFYVNGDFYLRKWLEPYQWKRVVKDAIVHTRDAAILGFCV